MKVIYINISKLNNDLALIEKKICIYQKKLDILKAIKEHLICDYIITDDMERRAHIAHVIQLTKNEKELINQ